MFARRSNDVPARPVHSPPPRILEHHTSGLRAPVALMYQPPAVVQEVLNSRKDGASNSRNNDASTSLGHDPSSLQVDSATTTRVIPDALIENSDLKPLGRKSTAYRDIVKSETPQNASAEKASNMFLDLSLSTPFPSPASPTIYDRIEVAPERRPSLVVKLKVKPEKLQRFKDGKKLKSAVVKLKLPNSRLFLSTLKREDERAKSPSKATPTAKFLPTPQTVHSAHVASPQRSSHAAQALQPPQLLPQTPGVSPTKNAALSLLHFSQNATVAPTTTNGSAKDSYLDLRVGNENVTPKFRNSRVDSMALPTMDYARYPWARPQQSQASVPTTPQPRAPLPPKTTVPYPDLFGTPTRPQSVAPFELCDGVPSDQVNATRASVAVQTQPKQKTKAKPAPLNKLTSTNSSSALDEIIRTAVKRSTSELRLTPSPTEDTMFARKRVPDGLPAADKPKLSKQTSKVSDASTSSIHSRINVAPFIGLPPSQRRQEIDYEICVMLANNQAQVIRVRVRQDGTLFFDAVRQEPMSARMADRVRNSTRNHPDDHKFLATHPIMRPFNQVQLPMPSTSIAIPDSGSSTNDAASRPAGDSQALSRAASMSAEHCQKTTGVMATTKTSDASPILNPKKRPAPLPEPQKQSTPAAKRSRSDRTLPPMLDNGDMSDTSDDVPLSIRSKTRGTTARMVETHEEDEADDSDEMPISQQSRRQALQRNRRVVSSSNELRPTSVGSIASRDSVIDSPIKVKSIAEIPDNELRKKAQTIKMLKATSHCLAGDIYSALLLKRGNVDQAMGVLVSSTYGQVTRQELGLRARNAQGSMDADNEIFHTFEPHQEQSPDYRTTPKPTKSTSFQIVTRTSSQEFEKAQDALRSDQRTRGSLAKVNDFIGSSPVKQKQKKNTGNVKAWLERKDLLRAVPSQLMYPVALEDRSLGKKSWSIIEDEQDLREEIEEEQERLQSSPPKKAYVRMDDPPKPTLGLLFGALSAPSILQNRINKLEEHVANELLVIQALARNAGVEAPNNELSSAIERRATTWLQHFRDGKGSFEKLCAKQGLFTPTMIEEPEREFAMPEDCQYEMNLRAMTRRHIWSMQQGTGGGLSMQDRGMIYRQLMQSESWRIGVSELTPMQSVERQRDGTMSTEKSLDVESTGKRVKRERNFAGMH